MCIQCGCINDPAGTAIAWAETSARSREKRLEDQIQELRERIELLELKMTGVKARR